MACHRCGSALDDAPGAACPRCFEHPRRPLRAILLGLVPRRPRTLLVLVAAAALAMAWAVRSHQRGLADDSGEFFTHEESAAYAAFQKGAALSYANLAEQKAAVNGPDRPYWERQAADARRRASMLEQREADYLWRAELKRRFREGGWW
jgi:hypothetical protein